MPRNGKNPNSRAWVAHPRYGAYSAKEKNDVGTRFTPAEIEFMMAMERYTREHDKPFPDCRDVLIVAKSLGYVKET